MPKARSLAIVLIALLASAWTLQHYLVSSPQEAELQLLDDADRFELFSLDPGFPPDQSARSLFYNHRILGSVVVSDPRVREILSNALRTGVRQHAGGVKACFEPRHGIRITHGSVTTDFVICFHCEQAQVWQNGKELHGLPLTNSPQSAFDKVLSDAGVPLAAPARD